MVAYSFIGAVAVLSSMVSAAPMPQVDVQGAPAPAEPWVETPAQPAEPWVETPAQPPAEPWQAPPAEPWQAPPAEPWQAPPAPAEPWHAPPVEPWKTWEHGSGKAPWTNTDYDDCVQKCIADHSPAPSEWKPSETVKEPVGPVGTGATHVVIVAPSQGVLRYVPYAIDAQVGDTVKFMWGANGHTVTQGSELLPCNKSEGGFTPSGLQDKDFVFTQVVNSTEPTYFYCAAQTHCSKGMFGIINPKKSAGSENSVEKLAPVMGETSEEANMWNVWSDAMTANNTKAAEWGNAIDMSAVPEEMRTYMLQNTAYTRSFLAANPETLSDDGKVTISGETPLIFPVDGVNALNNAAAASSNTEASGSASAAPSATDAAAPAESAPANDNGAGALTSPKALIAVIVAVATFFAL